MKSTIRESSLGQLPGSLVGIELRRIGWQSLQVKPLGVSAKLAYELASVGIPAIPQDEDVARELAEQLSQEIAGLELADVLRVESKVKAQALSAWGSRDPRDDRDPVAPINVMHGGRLPHGRPGGGDRGRQLVARFICGDEVGTQPLGVLLALGQSSRMNRRISDLLRSSAFFCGFWWLHPSECRSQPT